MNLRAFLEENKLHILAIDYIRKSGFVIVTNKGSLSSKEWPEISLMNESDLKALEQDFSLNLKENNKNITEKAYEVKNNLASSINTFIAKIAEMHLVEHNLLQNRDRSILSSVDDPDLRKLLASKIESVLKLSYLDPLTSCLSQTYYQHYFKDEVNCNRGEDIKEFNLMLESFNQASVDSVLFLDMNNFKMVNDLIGHRSGDVSLEVLGQKLNSYKDLIPIRRGGDEFVILGKNDILKQLQNELKSIDFLEQLNKHIPNDIFFNGKQVLTSVAVGFGEFHVPIIAENKLDVLNSKALMSAFINTAEQNMMLDKEKCHKELCYRDPSETIALLSTPITQEKNIQ